ncbi:MAG: ABC transporter ATP-binding protein [Parcubacteria group bacterium]|nr:ABC transporter ATP-binding protein [Parcubacteria group bacterium]
MSEHAIDLQNITHGYGSKVVLSSVNLRVSRGELLCLVGPTGCGKSTLFRLILGEEKPQKGVVMVAGKPKDGPGPDVGIVYQQYTLFPHLTVFENITHALMVRDTSIPERMFWRFSPRFRKHTASVRKRAYEYLDMVKLADSGKKYSDELSGGMRQRVAIAQALVMDPQILLMDEPFGSLDTFTREVLQLDLLRIWEQKKMTIVFVTHDLEEAGFMGTRLAVLSQHFYTDDPSYKGGSRIVMDISIDFPSPREPRLKESPELNGVLERVRRNPSLRGTRDMEILRAERLVLEHRDSIQVPV